MLAIKLHSKPTLILSKFTQLDCCVERKNDDRLIAGIIS